MGTVENSIVVDKPVRMVYDQWTQFEEFPRFMGGVEEVVQRDDSHLHWKASIAGVSREWDAEIVDQEPDRRISWVSTSGFKNDGTVSFDPVETAATRVTLRMEFQEESLAEKAADALGIAERRVEGDLERFKDFIESRDGETGAWRGEI
jgi:uncharacterized membrane protein